MFCIGCDWTSFAVILLLLLSLPIWDFYYEIVFVGDCEWVNSVGKLEYGASNEKKNCAKRRMRWHICSFQNFLNWFLIKCTATISMHPHNVVEKRIPSNIQMGRCMCLKSLSDSVSIFARAKYNWYNWFNCLKGVFFGYLLFHWRNAHFSRSLFLSLSNKPIPKRN